MVKRVIKEYFPQKRIDLDREIRHHPELMELLQQQEANEFEVRLVVIATYCEVILHGDYMQERLTSLCGELHKKLLAKRTGIIIVN